MKDLKAFMARAEGDSKLAKKLEAAATAEEVVAIAADAGYTFTADDLMDAQMEQVAGGVGWSDVRSAFRRAGKAAGGALSKVASDAGTAAIGVVAGAAVEGINKASNKLSGLGQGGSTIATPEAVEEWAPSDLFGGQ